MRPNNRLYNECTESSYVVNYKKARVLIQHPRYRVYIGSIEDMMSWDRTHSWFDLKHSVSLTDTARFAHEGIGHSIIRRLGLESIIVQSSTSLSFECVRNPGVLVSKVPNDDADATRTGFETAQDAIVIVFCLLSLCLCGVERSLRKPNIQFRDCDVQVGVDVGLLGSNLFFQRRGLAHDEMGLKSDSVDTDVSLPQFLGKLQDGISLRTGVLNAVVVVVELDFVRVNFGQGFLGKLECEIDILLADGLVPNATRERAVTVERFIDHIPRVAALAKMLDGLEDVIAHDGDQGLRGPISRCHPVGHLGRPDKVMATNGLSGASGQVHEVIAIGEVELIRALLGIHELTHESR